MWKQLPRAAGHLSILIVPSLLALAAVIDEPFLVVGFVLLLFPLARVVFGAVDAHASADWDERVATALDRLPLVYAAVLAAAVAALLARLSTNETSMATPTALGWSLSLWLTLLLATCVAHELLHRTDKVDRVVGHLLAALAGYPILGYEHRRHHRQPGNTAAAEWPRIDESALGFAARRLRALLPETLGARGLAVCGAAASPVVKGLRISIAATLGTWAVFGIAAGLTGVAIYAAVIVLVGTSTQLITYLQHWGLGDDSLDDARARQGSWECDCRFQAWVTMGLSLHQAHHRNSSLPYYRLGLAPDSPRLPAGYVLLLFAALVPEVWTRVMSPALVYWRQQPTAPLSAGRRVTCFGLYR